MYEQNDLAIRITIGANATKEQILEFFDNSECLITEENVETNHHINILLKTTSKVNTYRNKMNRHFKCVKNQSYCRLDKGNYIVYIMKENKVLKNTYCTSEELEIKRKLSYTKKDKPPSFHYSIVLNYVYKDDYCFPIDDYIASYVIKSLYGTLHNDFDIQKIGNAIASKFYPERYLAKSRNFNFFT